MARKALVTGATGFVGSNLVRGLLDNGWEVSIVVRPTSSIKEIDDLLDRISIHEYRGNLSDMVDAFSTSGAGFVFHIASLFLSVHRPDQVRDLIESNILFGAHILEAMDISGVDLMVNTSTSWVHYKNEYYSPANLYAATKQAFINVLQYYIEARSIRAITLELFDTYGKGDSRLKLLPLLLKLRTSKEKISMSPGVQEIDLVYIDDVVAAFLRAAERLLAGHEQNHSVYGVASGKAISLQRLVELVEQASGGVINVEWGGRPYRDREVMHAWTGFTPVPGWMPRVSLEEGIKRLVDGGDKPNA